MAQISDVEMSTIVLGNIVRNEYYGSKVLPYLDGRYFPDITERAIVETLLEHHANFSQIPTRKEIVVTMKNRSDMKSLDRNVIEEVLGNQAIEISNQKWLEEETERFIRRRRVSLAFETTYTDFEEGKDVDAFANIFQDAISFHFDSSIGHDFVADASLRWEYYTSKEEKHSLMLEMLDLITDGGVSGGTLNAFLAGTGVGKSFVMAAITAMAALQGSKVLVISLEMAEIKLAERIEANLMNVPLKEMKKLPRDEFTVRQNAYIEKMKQNGGNITFKQYPTSSAHAGHFRNLIIEAKNKMGIEYDLVVIDYLNICASMRSQKSDNSYTRIKSIAEELRALAIEFDVPIITATQTNKDGQTSTDLSLENVSESHGFSATVDLLIGLMSHPDWEAVNKLMMVQLKNRYGDLNYYRKFMIGISRAKMQMYNLKREASDEVNKHGEGKTTEVKDSSELFDASVLGKTKTTFDVNKLKT